MDELSVFYVVRNEEKHIGRSIASILSLTDEIVVVDTGSVDSTVQVCGRFPSVTVRSYLWCDDFSKARNYAVRSCSNPWVLYLDADEILDENDKQVVLSAIAKPKPSVKGFSLHIADYPDGFSACPQPSFFDSPQVRLFRKEDGVVFSGKAKESVAPSIEELGGSIDVLPARIKHYIWKGLGREFAEARLEYYRKLGLRIDLGSARFSEEQKDKSLIAEVVDMTEPAVANEEVAVVMCAMNALLNTKQAVSSMRENAGMPFTFHFLDNGSHDGTAEFFKSVPNSVTTTTFENVGVAKGRNLAATKALGNPSLKYIVFADNDIMVPAGWLTKMKDIMDSNGSLGILSAVTRLSLVQNKDTPDDAKRYLSRITLEHLNKTGMGRKDDLALSEMVTTTLTMIRLEMVKKIGLFDESFGIYGSEDKDYCLRARQVGYNVGWAHKVFIEHYGGASKRSINKNWHQIALIADSKFKEKWKPKPNQSHSVASVGVSLGEKIPEFMGPMPHVSIVIIAHNRLDMTKDCLNSIKSNTNSYELIFVDNASDDGTPEWVSKYFPRAKLIRNDDNLGVPKARNQGIRASTGNYIVMMDNDCVVSNGWLGDLFSPMKSGASITGIEAWVLDGNKMPVRKCVSQGESFGYLGGACCLYKRSVFEGVGLLDEGFSPAYFEDVDISLRAQKMGLRLAWIPTPKIQHREHATLVYSQKTFSYQGAMGQSAERHRGKLNKSIEFTPEFLPRRERKLKILYAAMYYDYGIRERGLSFEQDNFYPTFEQWEHTKELRHFDFVDLGKQHGIPRMSDMLVEAVDDFTPDALFIIPFDENHDPRKEALRRITEHTACKTIAWFCDSHHRYQNFDSKWAPNLDYCVTTAKMAEPWYIRDGFGQKMIKSQWFASPKYKKFDVPKDVGVSFVGQPHGDRRQTISWLRQNGMSVQTYGTGWGERLSFDDMIMMFNRSKINLNLANASDSRFKQIKGRNFEVPGCGGLLVTELAENLADYYTPGKEIVSFSSINELPDIIRHYLVHDDERAAIAEAAYARTMSEHTGSHRLDSIFARAGLL